MKIQPVILCGGSGTRLWPESRETFPKPFLPLIDGQTLFELTLKRCQAIPGALPPIIVINAQQAHLAQLGAQNLGMGQPRLLIEPVGRNTAPALTAATLLAQTIDPEAAILALPADHLIEPIEAFVESVITAAEASSTHLITFGVVPDHPETGFGYIEVEQRETSTKPAAIPVRRFVEKPDVDTARRYVEGGRHLWNAGIFVYTSRVFLEELEVHSPTVLAATRAAFAKARETDSRQVLPAHEFEQCPNISIDYALFEKSDRVATVPVRFNWSDIGSWSAVAAVTHGIGNAVVSVDSKNCFVRSEGRAIGLIGVENLTVIDTEDALLITDRNRTQDVRQVVERVRAVKPELTIWRTTTLRPWGSFTLLADQADHKVKRVTIKPGAALSLQLHHHRSETWTFVSGRGEVTLNERTFEVGPEQTVFIPVRSKHRVRNTGREPLVFIETQTGTSFDESDIVRFEDQYGRV